MIITKKNEAQEETHIEQIVQPYFPHLSTSQLCLFFSSSWFSLRSKLKDIIDKGNNLYYYHTYYIYHHPPLFMPLLHNEANDANARW